MFALFGDERAQCWNSSEWRSVKPVMLNRGPNSMRVLPATCGELICLSRAVSDDQRVQIVPFCHDLRVTERFFQRTLSRASPSCH